MPSGGTGGWTTDPHAATAAPRRRGERNDVKILTIAVVAVVLMLAAALAVASDHLPQSDERNRS